MFYLPCQILAHGITMATTLLPPLSSIMSKLPSFCELFSNFAFNSCLMVFWCICLQCSKMLLKFGIILCIKDEVLLCYKKSECKVFQNFKFFFHCYHELIGLFSAKIYVTQKNIYMCVYGLQLHCFKLEVEVSSLIVLQKKVFVQSSLSFIFHHLHFNFKLQVKIQLPISY